MTQTLFDLPALTTQTSGRSSVLNEALSFDFQPCPQAHVLLLDHACSLLLCAILRTIFNIRSKITLKKCTTTITSSRLKHRLQSQGLLCMWIILSGLCTDSQSRNGLSSYQANERRKIQNRFHGQR